MSNLTRRDIEGAIYTATPFQRQAIMVIVPMILEAIQAALAAGRKVEFRDFGTFTVLKRQPKTGRDIPGGKPVPIPATAVVKFRSGQKLRRMMKKTDLSRLKVPKHFRRRK